MRGVVGLLVFINFMPKYYYFLSHVQEEFKEGKHQLFTLTSAKVKAVFLPETNLYQIL